MIHLEEIALEVGKVAKETGKFISSNRASLSQASIETKGTHNYVTTIDKQAEQRIVEALSVIFSDAGFITEEETIQNEIREYNWIIDPLDGTTNFIHDVPVVSVSIALVHKNRPIIGAIYEIGRDELFLAWDNGPALLNGKEIRVTKQDNLNESLLATGFPYYDYGLMDSYLKLFRYLMENSRGLRRLGSAAADMAYVACGRFEAFYEYGLHPWDVAAGTVIIRQAGGVVTDFNNGESFMESKRLLATNGAVHEAMLNAIEQYFR